MLKMITRKGETVVLDGNKEKMRAKGKNSIAQALNYVFIKRFMTKVDGTYKPTCTRSLYTVNSLIPSMCEKSTTFKEVQ